MKTILHLLTLLLLTSLPGVGATTNQLGALTLEQALALAEQHHPQLAEARALVEAAAGRAQQAGTRPNPEVVVRAEQIPFKDTPARDRQYVVGFAQTVPLGSKVAKARQAELQEQEARTRQLEVVRRDVRKRVHTAFATALYQEQAARIQTRIAEDFTRTIALIKARLVAGDAVPEELARSEMELARAEVEARRSLSLQEQAGSALIAALGSTELRLPSLAGNLEAAFEVPTLESLTARLAEHPELLEAQAAQKVNAARLELAMVQRIPDVTAEVLYRRLEATRQNTLDFGFRIPLPWFTTGQGRVREARAEAVAAEARSRSTQAELQRRLYTAHAELTTALANRRALKDDILPRATTVLAAVEARHTAGELALNDVLSARREWAAVQLAHLESLRDVMRAWAEISGHLKAL
jgi:cobalt-zinc-cadmium efflux system outer membrane protein